MDLGLAAGLGIASGLAATVPMTLVEMLARRFAGPSIILDWIQNEASTARLWRPHPRARVPLGLALHFLHGAIAGLLFFVAVSLVSSTVPLLDLAIAYGLILWILSLASFRRLVGANSSIGSTRIAAPIVSLATHLVYAVSLGALGIALGL
jgi:hypothetical protein